MGFDHYLKLVKKMNNLGRWSTEFMHIRPSLSEHGFSVAQVGQLLAYIEEQNKTTIDWNRLAIKLTNNDILESITGHLTNQIKSQNPKMKEMLHYIEEESAQEHLFSKLEPPYNQVYKELIFSRKDDTIEGKILDMSNKIVTLLECHDEIELNNLYPFSKTHEDLLAKLKNSDLYSVKFFLKNILPEIKNRKVKKATGLGKYLLTTKKLSNIKRWSTEFMHKKTSVSQHSFSVAQIGQMLAVIEQEKGREINWRRVFQYTINHDLREALTGDILSTVKHKKVEMKELVEVIEKEIVEEQLLAQIPSPYEEIYRELLFTDKDETFEGKILTAADNIDALLECIDEIQLSNDTPFSKKYNDIMEKIVEIDLPSVKYFLDEILPKITSEKK